MQNESIDVTLKVTGDLDLEYLRKWGYELKVADLLERAIGEAGEVLQ